MQTVKKILLTALVLTIGVLTPAAFADHHNACCKAECCKPEAECCK